MHLNLSQKYTLLPGEKLSILLMVYRVSIKNNSNKSVQGVELTNIGLSIMNIPI